jgi:hypothetical protein
MKIRQIALFGVLTVLPVAMGCGHFKGLLFGPGAPCNACMGGTQGYNIAPPACSCGMEQGCGGETYGSYYGGADLGYAADGSVIGAPGMGPGIYSSGPSNGYHPDNWVAPGEQMVPNSLHTYETPSDQGMSPTPAPSAGQ